MNCYSSFEIFPSLKAINLAISSNVLNVFFVILLFAITETRGLFFQQSIARGLFFIQSSHEERPPLPDGRDGLTRSFMHIANH